MRSRKPFGVGRTKFSHVCSWLASRHRSERLDYVGQRPKIVRNRMTQRGRSATVAAGQQPSSSFSTHI